MMYEANPLIRARWYLTTSRNARDTSPENEEADPPAYSRMVDANNFQQEQRGGIDGGGIYFAKAGGSFLGYGYIDPGSLPVDRWEVDQPMTYEYLSSTRRRVHSYREKKFRKEGHDVNLLEDVEYHKPHLGVIYTKTRKRRTLERRKENGALDWTTTKDEEAEETFDIDLSPIDFDIDTLPGTNIRREFRAVFDDVDGIFKEEEVLVYHYNEYLMEDLDQESGLWFRSLDPNGMLISLDEIFLDYSVDPEDPKETCSPADYNAGLG